MYTPYVSKLVWVSYVDDSLYRYTSEKIVKWFVDTLGDIFHVKFLIYSDYFLPIRISHLKGHFISVDHSRFATYVVSNYLDTFRKKKISNFHKTKLPYYIILTK